MLPRPLRREQGAKQYERSEREKEQTPLFSSQRPRQHERGLAMRSYIGKGKLSLFWNSG